jgi:CheY-like chemotaxis protein
MIPAFDIFLIDPNENPCWLEAVGTLAEAERRARALLTPACPRCLILDQHTGQKHIVDRATSGELRLVETPMGKTIKVLLAEDNEVVRRTIRQLLGEEPEIELVGEASTFGQTIQMAKDLKPQVVLLDLHMRDQAVLTPADVKLGLHCRETRIVAISVWNDEETKALAESSGAFALLDKMVLASDLIPVIKAAVSDLPILRESC